MTFSKKRILLVGFLFTVFLSSSFVLSKDWGFFGHRRINRLAVFTLPVELIPFYKKHIDYLTINAVSPDKRRYVIPTEGIRHYIDLDIWGQFPFEHLPKSPIDVGVKYVEVCVINEQKDSLWLFGQRMEKGVDGDWILSDPNLITFFRKKQVYIDQEDYKDFFYEKIYNALYESTWKIDCKDLQEYFDRYDLNLSCKKAIAVDTFVKHGVLPYNLVRLQKGLTDAMLLMNRDLILRISADIGHYIADAHVPLHTTSNYNGYFTDQIGIHAFWETRLPELFADDTYDFFVGRAKYIDNPKEYYWNIVFDSHALVDDVLGIEKALSKQFPITRQDCFEKRGNGCLQKVPCYEYALKYHDALKGQVEQQMRKSIHAIGSAWYTAWIDAGQPNFSRLGSFAETKESRQEQLQVETAIKSGEIIGRKH